MPSRPFTLSVAHMGKTKTALVEAEVADITGKEAYEKKRQERARKEAEKKSVQAAGPDSANLASKRASLAEDAESRRAKPSGKAEKIHIAGLKGGQRIKTIEAEVLSSDAEVKAKEAKKTKKEKVRSKKYQEAKKKIDKTKTYSLSDAIRLAKETSYSSFDGSIELHLVVKKVGTSANVTLPHQAGRVKKIEIADDATVEKLKKGKIDFDVLLATPEMMPKLVPYARILGPKGLMPNPKSGTIISDSKKANKFSASAITLKTEKEAPLIHTVVGKVSQKDEELLANSQAILKALGGEKQILKAFAKASMGPSVKVSIAA